MVNCKWKFGMAIKKICPIFKQGFDVTKYNYNTPCTWIFSDGLELRDGRCGLGVSRKVVEWYCSYCDGCVTFQICTRASWIYNCLKTKKIDMHELICKRAPSYYFSSKHIVWNMEAMEAMEYWKPVVHANMHCDAYSMHIAEKYNCSIKTYLKK